MDLSQRSDLTQSVHRSSGSYELVVGAVLFSLIGLIVDRWAGTTPWLTVASGFVGFIGAAVSIYFRYRAEIAGSSRIPSLEGSATQGSPS